MAFTLILPSRDSSQTPSEEIVSETNSIVIVGANGSGKSRLSKSLFGMQRRGNEANNNTFIISARRGLKVPERVQPETPNAAQRRAYNVASTNETLNDFDAVFSLLIAQQARRDREYSNQVSKNRQWMEQPQSPIEILQELWRDLLPQKDLEINLDEGMLQLRSYKDNSTYHAIEMSDGERAAFYLMGKCLCAPSGSILVIDEPEIHLHKSILNQMWDRLEMLCSSCLFVYLTHDLDFAASRTTNKKIWIKEFTPHGWKWDEIQSVDSLPEELLMTVLGSPKPILFVEGTKGSIDYAIYRNAYPEYLVLPRSSTEEVIQSTKAFGKFSEIATVRFYPQGIIDRDYRDDTEIIHLKQSNIHTLDVASIENLLCVKEIVSAMASLLEFDEPTVVNQAVRNMLEKASTNMEQQVSRRTADMLRASMQKQFSTDIQTKTALAQAISNFKNDLTEMELYVKNEQIYQVAIDTQDYNALLRLYKSKDILEVVSRVFGMSIQQYKAQFLRFLTSPDKRQMLLDALKPHLPVLTVFANSETSE